MVQVVRRALLHSLGGVVEWHRHGGDAPDAAGLGVHVDLEPVFMEVATKHSTRARQRGTARSKQV